MTKRFVVVSIIVSLAIAVPVFLLFPTTYKITVHSSNYFSSCNDINKIKCETFNPPKTIIKKEPFIVASWNKSKVDRQFAEKEVTTSWANENAQFKISETILSATILLTPIFIFVGLVYLFIASLIKAFRLKDSERIAWICLIIFVFPLGSIILLLVKPKPSK